MDRRGIDRADPRCVAVVPAEVEVVERERLEGEERPRRRREASGQGRDRPGLLAPQLVVGRRSLPHPADLLGHLAERGAGAVGPHRGAGGEARAVAGVAEAAPTAVGEALVLAQVHVDPAGERAAEDLRHQVGRLVVGGRPLGSGVTYRDHRLRRARGVDQEDRAGLGRGLGDLLRRWGLALPPREALAERAADLLLGDHADDEEASAVGPQLRGHPLAVADADRVERLLGVDMTVGVLGAPGEGRVDPPGDRRGGRPGLDERRLATVAEAVEVLVAQPWRHQHLDEEVERRVELGLEGADAQRRGLALGG